MSDKLSDDIRAAANDVMRAENARMLSGWHTISHDLWVQCVKLAKFANAYLGAGWRPISTAPKDGTLFLAYAAPGQHGLPELYSLCAWHEDVGFCIDELREPTHWMKLPAPPAPATLAPEAPDA